MWISPSACLLFGICSMSPPGTFPCPRCPSNSAPDKKLKQPQLKSNQKNILENRSRDTPSVEWATVLFAVIHEIICQWDRKREALPSILFFIVSVRFCSCGFIAPWEVSDAALPSIVPQRLFCVGSRGFLYSSSSLPPAGFQFSSCESSWQRRARFSTDATWARDSN